MHGDSGCKVEEVLKVQSKGRIVYADVHATVAIHSSSSSKITVLGSELLQMST